MGVFRVPDGCQETTTTDPITSPVEQDYTLAGAVTGFEPFIDEMDDTDWAIILVRNDSDFEIFIGILNTTGTKITRKTMLRSSNGDNPVGWAGGTTKNVIGVAPGAGFLDFMHRDSSGTATATGSGDATGIASRGPGPDDFKFHTLEVSPVGPITVDNGDGSSDGAITLDQTQVPALNADETFLGNLTFSGTLSLSGELTLSADTTNLTPPANVHTIEKSGTNRFAVITNVGGTDDDWKLEIYQGGSLYNTLTENDIPMSGLTVGAVAYADSATSFSTAVGAPLLLSTTTISTDSDVDVTLPSGWGSFMIEVVDLLMTTAGDDLISRVDVGGGYLTTGYDTAIAVTAPSIHNRQSDTSHTYMYLSESNQGLSSSRPAYYRIHVMNPGDGTEGFYCQAEGSYYGTSANKRMLVKAMGQQESNKTRATGFRLTELASGTLKSGTVRLYGIA
jgi:hypothetical protein